MKIVTMAIAVAVCELLEFIDKNFRLCNGIPVFNALVGVVPCKYWHAPYITTTLRLSDGRHIVFLLCRG